MRIIRNILLLTAVVIATMTATSCRELAQNGDFSGQWQVLSIDYADGTTVDPAGTRYYCIYRDVAQLTGSGSKRITGNLAYDEDAGKFSIEFPLEKPGQLSSWGITFGPDVDPDQKGCTANFTINSLSSSRLIMTTETGNVITCRKY